MEPIFESPREARGLRDAVASRTRYTLRRLGWFVASVKVALRREPQGEPRLSCRVEVLPREGAPIVVVSRARSWSEAIGAALRRAAQSVAAALRRRPERRFPRPRPQLPGRR